MGQLTRFRARLPLPVERVQNRHQVASPEKRGDHASQGAGNDVVTCRPSSLPALALLRIDAELQVRLAASVKETPYPR